MRGAIPLGVLALLAYGAGCNTQRAVFQSGIPGSEQEMTVASVTQRAGYLDVVLHASGWSMQTYLPATEACARTVQGESGTRWITASAYGTLARGGLRCDAVGIGSLEEWRSKRPRPSRGGSPIPSARASFQRVYEDEEVLLLRGDFPLAREVGFAALGDVIAVVPNVPVCEKPASHGQATLEFFPGGRKVLTLGSARGRCPVIGLLQPLRDGVTP